MIVTFCGHADFQEKSEDKGIVLDILERIIGNANAELLLGAYGNFDSFAYECCRIYKERHSNVSVIWVTPYLNQKRISDFEKKFDSVVYPEIESKPKKFAITYCNRYMVEKSDFVIAYVSKNWGGAYATYKFAKKHHKTVFNLATL